jgi:NAD(P)H-hydrate epimerase
MATLTRKQVRKVDQRAIAEYGMSSLVLMENAARGTADVLCQLLEDDLRASGPVTIVCGKGNNGGDGFSLALLLEFRLVTVKVLLLCSPDDLTGDAAANFAITHKAGIPIGQFLMPFEKTRFDVALSKSAWLVDAILGTGAVGEPKSPYAEAIDRMNASGIPILAVDLPSGLDCDTGVAARHTIRATHTCTFVATKPGFFATGASHYVGNLLVVDIGVPRRLMEEIEREADE